MEWAIQMSVFCIKDFEGVLLTMIEACDRHSHKSSVPYLGYDIVISFWPTDFTRVFFILGAAQGGKKIDNKPKKWTEEIAIGRISVQGTGTA